MEDLIVKLDQEIPNQYGKSKISSWNYKVDNNANVFFNFNYANADNKPQTAIGLIEKNSSSVIGMDINVEGSYR